MTSAARTSNYRRGFTLLEIVVVLAIAAVVLGGAVGVMVFSGDERSLRNASGEIESMAKRARTIAILKQIPYALEFRPGVVRLMPFAQAGTSEKKTALGNTIGGQRESASDDESREVVLNDGMGLRVRRWNSEAWLTATDDFPQVWRFDPDGLCEPLSVRLTLDKSWAEDTYHPLTATIRDSQLEAR